MAFSLAFSQAPPDHPFVGEFFPVQLTLIDGDHEIHGGIELPLSLELYYPVTTNGATGKARIMKRRQARARVYDARET